MQTVASFLDQSLAVVGPLLTAGLGIPAERIGHFSSLSAFGVVLFLTFGTPLLARFGPVRMLQVGTALAVLGLTCAASRWWPLMFLAPVLIGIGYGPNPPAGSRILSATAPGRHRTLIFSLKQAGAPAGGALAGLLLAPAAAAWGWPGAIALAIAIAICAAFAIEPARTRLDVERDPARPVRPSDLLRPANVIAPFRLIRDEPGLLTLTALAVSFSIVQGSLFSFAVTYLVISRELSLAEAGIVYACLQAAGVVARIAIGWLADRTGSAARNLAVQALAAAAMVCGFGSLPEHTPLEIACLVAGATGFFAVSWNGVFMAEVARLAPPDRVVEATASSGVITFLGYMAGPTLFSLLVTAAGSYKAAFLAVAAQLACVATVQLFLLFRHSGQFRA
ncbi:MFS transporter [uncultured Enterovirga sp.]|uniref:MFS transporter n=1 Tax=uncultured Enterovirga sp. TaxID=2026352 RepID=UPI0035C994D4